LILSSLLLMAPQTGIGDDKTHPGRRDRRHARGLFLIEQGVEVCRVCRVCKIRQSRAI
jgi:hypothetical protein